MATTQITPDNNAVLAEIFIAAPPDRYIGNTKAPGVNLNPDFRPNHDPELLLEL